MTAAKYTNFYETVKEAEMRLRNSIVLYDGEPYYVLCIDNHMTDGIFRIYLDTLGWPGGLAIGRGLSVPYECGIPENSSRGALMDKWLNAHPDKGIIRRHMNSPLFNKYRPFPLGMLNTYEGARYVMRTPQRQTLQGLSQSLITGHALGLYSTKERVSVDIFSPFFYACIKGLYPDPKEALEKIQDPDIQNQSIGISRDLAFVRGPINTVYLAHKTDIIGVLPTNTTRQVRLGRSFGHLLEAVKEANIFDEIVV